jgi:hypothetical protein
MKNEVLKCPDCEEVSTFTHSYQVQHSAPVVLGDGEITIDYDNETKFDPQDDEDTCTCDKCGREVQIDAIEIANAEELHQH